MKLAVQDNELMIAVKNLKKSENNLTKILKKLYNNFV